MAGGSTPRFVALGVVIWRDHVLLAPSTIPGDPPGWRCPGGAIALGERARDAVAREFIEEMGRRIDVLEDLPVIEDIREHRGALSHEISFPFLASWRDGYEPVELSPIVCVEPDGTRFEARWIPLSDLTGGDLTIHPVGFAELLADRLALGAVPSEAIAPAPAPVRRPLEDGESRRGAQRAIALGHLLWRDRVLLHPVLIPGALPAWRSLGGAIEFGERAEDALRREFVEETGRVIEIAAAKGVAENIFERDGVIGHELVFEYLVQWASGQEPADLAELDCVESGGSPFRACWMPLGQVLDAEHVIYPAGFVERLREWVARGGRA